jgi:hypothetical protein
MMRETLRQDGTGVSVGCSELRAWTRRVASSDCEVARLCLVRSQLSLLIMSATVVLLILVICESYSESLAWRFLLAGSAVAGQ